MIEAISVDDRMVQAELHRMLGRSQNPSPAMAGIAVRMASAIDDNFRAQGRPTRWNRLKASTIAARAKAGRAGLILQASGKLRASMTPFHGRDFAGVGTNRPYAAAMNNGSRPHTIVPRTKKALAFNGRFAKRVRHPGTSPRPFMVLLDVDKADIIKIMGQHIMSGM
jgi:phage gpG-like protein